MGDTLQFVATFNSLLGVAPVDDKLKCIEHTPLGLALKMCCTSETV